MVANTIQPNSSTSRDNKENVPVLRSTNGQESRSRTDNSPSQILNSREASRNSPRRRPQSPATLHVQIPVEDTDVASNGAASTSNYWQSTSVNLPRHLARAPFKAISPAAIEAVDPALKEVAIEAILDGLKAFGPEMLNVASTTVVDPYPNRLTQTLEVLVQDFSSDTPTHVFAVHSNAVKRVILCPVHALIFAAHCARFPPIPYMNSAEATEDGKKLILPVVPLNIPNLSTFPILLHYLYTKRGDHLLASLMPMAPREPNPSRKRMSQAYADTFTVQTLMSYAGRVHGLWSNVSWVGVFDTILSRVIDVAWEILFDALAISIARNRRRGETQ